MIHPEIIVRVTDIAVVAESVKQFTFERVDGGSMPVFAPGKWGSLNALRRR